MQTSPVNHSKSMTSASILSTGREIIRIDGMGAFLDGLGLRCARKAASSAIGWTIFEAGRALWVQTDKQKRDKLLDSVRLSS
jgi:solute carrier family 25 protein 38